MKTKDINLTAFFGPQNVVPHCGDLDALKPKLVPFAQAGAGLYRTWMEVERHPWDGKL